MGCPLLGAGRAQPQRSGFGCLHPPLLNSCKGENNTARDAIYFSCTRTWVFFCSLLFASPSHTFRFGSFSIDPVATAGRESKRAVSQSTHCSSCGLSSECGGALV
jgi:hypothetical protein